MDPYHAFLDYIIKAFVDHPEDVKIVQTLDKNGVLLTLTVHADDMGKVLGSKGKFIEEVIRPIVRVVGYKHNARVSVLVDEPVGGKRYDEFVKRDLSSILGSLGK
ncbi:MAG: KH domain-containing protein [Patescibacteria group bacterium]